MAGAIYLLVVLFGFLHKLIMMVHNLAHRHPRKIDELYAKDKLKVGD